MASLEDIYQFEGNLETAFADALADVGDVITSTSTTTIETPYIEVICQSVAPNGQTAVHYADTAVQIGYAANVTVSIITDRYDPTQDHDGLVGLARSKLTYPSEKPLPSLYEIKAMNQLGSARSILEDSDRLITTINFQTVITIKPSAWPTT